MKKDYIRTLGCFILSIGSLLLMWGFMKYELLILFILYVVCAVFSFVLLPAKWNGYFLASFFLCSLFFLFPSFLNFDTISEFISEFVSGLKTTEYKTAYFESLGALLGSFLAITGAMWVENKARAAQNEEEDAVNARVVYYDLEFAFNQVRDVLEKSNNKKDIAEPDDYSDYKKYHDEIQNYIVLIDDNWIRTVSSLPERAYKEIQRKHLYLLYDHLCGIRKSLGRCPDTFDSKKKTLYKDAYRKMYNFLFIGPDGYRPEFAASLDEKGKAERECTNDVWKTLIEQAKIPPKTKK